jgi:hypothetical protein
MSRTSAAEVSIQALSALLMGDADVCAWAVDAVNRRAARRRERRLSMSLRSWWVQFWIMLPIKDICGLIEESNAADKLNN